jgi:hypothetical protein
VNELLVELDIICPGCGNTTMLKIPPDRMKIECQCPKCYTKWTLTIQTDEEALQREFSLAEDYD